MRGSSLLSQPDLPVLGARRPPRVGAPYARSPVPCRGPHPPRHRAERAHAEADYDEETARDNYFNPPAGHRSGPGGPTDA